MRVTLVQFAPRFPGRQENWDRIVGWADSVESDVVVFPELTSCGYCYDGPEEIRDYVDAPSSLVPLEAIARRRHRLLIGGFAERADGRFYNSAYAVSPEGTMIYRKIHLWNKEKKIFRAGSQPLTLEFQGHRLGVEICYDLQFPELASYYARAGTEVLLVPTAWAEEPVGLLTGLQPYTHLALATAFSHGIYVALANRSGLERGALFPGESSITDPFGRMRHLGPEEGMLTSELDFSLLPPAKHPNERNDLDGDARLGISLPHEPPEVGPSPRAAGVPRS
jgi:N-carbamoylputrescine amidase